MGQETSFSLGWAYIGGGVGGGGLLWSGLFPIKYIWSYFWKFYLSCFKIKIFELFSGFSEVNISLKTDVSTRFRQKDQEDNVLCLLQEDSHKHWCEEEIQSPRKYDKSHYKRFCWQSEGFNLCDEKHLAEELHNSEDVFVARGVVTLYTILKKVVWAFQENC